MCRNRTVGGSGTRLYSSLRLSNVAQNAVMMCMQTCYCAYKPIGYPFLEAVWVPQDNDQHVPATRYQCVVSAFPVVFCALKASFGIVTMPVVLAERVDEQSCTGNGLLSSLSEYLDKMIGYGLGRSKASVGQVWAGSREGTEITINRYHHKLVGV